MKLREFKNHLLCVKLETLKADELINQLTNCLVIFDLTFNVKDFQVKHSCNT